ncbi:MAG: peptidylprolyl isomerase [Sulfurimonas sp.]|uniref:peptidylprolyl isomerase n=1 Tax=Sulfurimonas sp. TaxID=2022749 RepID=UPI0028CE03F5|nr:peptidylprolyl isomerase [Sulfurimonas sp.]MDT8337669.1 peptidylprolyl isomerase [Sulfurimonas sp.]
MNKLFLIAALAVSLFGEKTLLPESTVAVVNGIAISVDERDKEVGKLLPKAYFHSSIDEEKLKNLQEQALESLIEKTLLYSYALSKNINTTESEIDEVMTNLAARYGSKDLFEGAIKRLGFTKATFRDAVKKDEVLKKLYKQEIEVEISDKELREYYDKNMHKFKEPEKVRVRLIHVRNNPEDPEGREKAKKRIDEAFQKLEEGEYFADVAAKYSTAMSRIKGGDMGYLHRGRLQKAVEDVAFSMDINKTSKIIEQDIGYFIVKVEDKLVPNQLSFEKIKDGLAKDLKEKEESRRKSELLKRLMQNSVIVK